MFSKIFNPGKKKPLEPKEPRSAMGDSMSVDGSNCELFESLMADVSEDDDREIRKAHAADMRKLGYAESTIELMLNPRPVNVQSSAE
jgi:hypothetical protein